MGTRPAVSGRGKGGAGHGPRRDGGARHDERPAVLPRLTSRVAQVCRPRFGGMNPAQAMRQPSARTRLGGALVGAAVALSLPAAAPAASPYTSAPYTLRTHPYAFGQAPVF